MFESILSLLGPFWEAIAITGGVLLGMVLAYFNGVSTGKTKQKVKQMEADLKGADNARETANRTNRQSRDTNTDELLDDTNGFRD